jgi:hypothetical protein
MATGFRQCSAIAWLFFIKYISTAYAQKLPSVLQVPPLQWLNITDSILGATPAAVKYSSIGYDPTTNNLIIFGGESSSGIPTDQTYLYVQFFGDSNISVSCTKYFQLEPRLTFMGYSSASVGSAAGFTPSQVHGCQW